MMTSLCCIYNKKLLCVFFFLYFNLIVLIVLDSYKNLILFRILPGAHFFFLVSIQRPDLAIQDLHDLKN